MNGWMYLIFRTKVPEISGGHNGRQDQLFRVDARAHRPPLHRAHSIYQSKFNHLEQMTLVTFKLVRLTLRLSVFFLKCSCISKCPTWRFLVAVWTNIRCRFILPQNHGSSPVGSPPQILCWILYFKHTLCFLFFFSPHFQPENLYPKTTWYGIQQEVLQYLQDRYTCSTCTFVGQWRILSRWTENDTYRSTLNMNLFIHLLQSCYRNDHKYTTICFMYETFTCK